MVSNRHLLTSQKFHKLRIAVASVDAYDCYIEAMK